MVAYDSVISIIETAVLGFEVQVGIQPNRLTVSADVFNYLAQKGLLIIHSVEKQKLYGMTVDVIHDKELFIEIGYMSNAKNYSKE